MKEIVDELKIVTSSISDLKDLLSQRIDGVEKVLSDRFHALETAAQVFDDWKPKIEASVDDLRVEIGAMRKTVNRVMMEASSASAAGIFAKPGSAPTFPAAEFPADGPDGHHVESSNRVHGFGSIDP